MRIDCKNEKKTNKKNLRNTEIPFCKCINYFKLSTATVEKLVHRIYWFPTLVLKIRALHVLGFFLMPHTSITGFSSTAACRGGHAII